MAQKEFLSNAGLEHYDEKIKEYIGDHSSNDIVALKEESPATAAHSVGEYITYNHIVYEVIDDISIDDLLIVDSNIEVATLAEGTVIYSDDDDGGGGSTLNYNALDNKPQVNGVELSGNKSATDLGLVASVEGKGLSTNDYDNTEKGKVADNTSAIEAIVNENGCCNVLPLDIGYMKRVNTVGTWNNNVYTFDSVSFTVNADNIVVNGTPSNNIDFFISSLDHLKTGVKYTCSAGNNNGSIGTFHVNIPSGGPNTDPEAPKFDFVYNGNQPYVRIIVMANTQVNNEVFKPMLYDARLNPTGYVPYAMTNMELTEKVERGSVSVVADGVKTYSQLFYSLITSADLSKITKDTCVSFGNLIFRIARIETGDYRFGLVTLSGSNVETYAIVLNTTSDNSCKFFISKTSSNSTVAYNDASATVISSGSVLSLYY